MCPGYYECASSSYIYALSTRSHRVLKRYTAVGYPGNPGGHVIVIRLCAKLGVSLTVSIQRVACGYRTILRNSHIQTHVVKVSGVALEGDVVVFCGLNTILIAVVWSTEGSLPARVLQIKGVSRGCMFSGSIICHAAGFTNGTEVK